MRSCWPRRYHRRLCDQVFPVAAGDVFFNTPAISLFSATLLNALPMWRKNCGPHALAELKKRLIEEPCGLILFPEGNRSRDGTLGPFKPGLGMLTAGTAVPVIPCHLSGAFHAFPPAARLPRPTKIRLKIGRPLVFDSVPNRRAGWEEIAAHAHEAIRRLGDAGIEEMGTSVARHDEECTRNQTRFRIDREPTSGISFSIEVAGYYQKRPEHRSCVSWRRTFD